MKLKLINAKVEDLITGYNLGTTASTPHKQAPKPYQNDTVLARKTMKFIICIEPQKKFE